MPENKRKCTRCGLEIDPVSGLCAYCETEELRALGREMTERDKRNCKRCNTPIAPDGLCDFCAMDNLRDSESKNEQKCERCGTALSYDGTCAYCNIESRFEVRVQLDGDKHKCIRCNRLCFEEVNELGLCRDCALQIALGEEERERRVSQVELILTGPPTPDELAAAAAVCERLATHIDRQEKRDWTHRATHLRDTVGILRAFLTPVLIALFMIVGCSNATNDDTKEDQYVDPDFELTYGDAQIEESRSMRTYEPDAAIDLVEEQDAAIDELVDEQDAAIDDLVDKQDASQDASPIDEQDASQDASPIDEQDASQDASLVDKQDASRDASITDCDLLGIWSVRISQSVFCIRQDDPFVVEITDCEQTDIEQPLETTDPQYGDFSGSITFHVAVDGQSSLTGTADISGTVSINGQELNCSSTATIAGNENATK